MELRCPAKLHGELLTPGSGTLEISCDSRWCGKRPGVTVRHRFDLSTGDYTTMKYKTETRSKADGS